MKPSRQQRVLDLLDATLSTPVASRTTFLAEACGGDRELQEEVESLLALEEEADSFLPEPIVPRPADSQALEKGFRIGPYRIVELLGRGGMGAVYRAVREDDFEKQVAIKLLQRDLVSEATVRRFHNERQILARLEHPEIARLLDGGTTSDNRPYLVMEYVDGIPIDQYCDDYKLTIKERLELFLRVSRALAFAHQNLVVHRDLKPGNILITEDGSPKLLDFGIAKLLDPEHALRRDLTQGMEQPMTPRYASPEQVLRQPITTASDIYGLGSLLYKLLTGRLPCGLESCRFGEIPWRIVEVEPVKPSSAIGREEEVETAEGSVHWTPETVSQTREGDSQRLRRRLAGDVDAIVMKALRKEPQHRYASVDQFVADIESHLAGLPVSARRGTMLYLGSKFVRRHRMAIAAGLVILIAAAALLLRERQRLEERRQRAERVSEVLQGLLVNIADPDRRDSVTATLEDARQQLEVLEADPDLRSDLLAKLGEIHRKLGHFDTAIARLRESLEIWRQHYPNDHGSIATRINNIGSLYFDRGELDAAERQFREAADIYKDLGEESEGRIVNLHNLASILMFRGAFDEAEELYRNGLDIRLRTLGNDDPAVATSLRNLGALLFERGDVVAAEAPLRRALEIRLQSHGEEHTKVASVLDLLGRVRFGQGDTVEAERLFRRALAIRRLRLGDDHFLVAASERNWAALLLAEGDLAAARSLVTRAYSSVLGSQAQDDWKVAYAEVILGSLLTAEGRFSEAEPCIEGGLQILQEARGEHNAYTQDARRRLDLLNEAKGQSGRTALLATSE